MPVQYFHHLRRPQLLLPRCQYLEMLPLGNPLLLAVEGGVEEVLTEAHCLELLAEPEFLRLLS